MPSEAAANEGFLEVSDFLPRRKRSLGAARRIVAAVVDKRRRSRQSRMADAIAGL